MIAADHHEQAQSPSIPGALPVLGYCRVSSAEQAASGLGMAAQRAAISAEADRRGWSVDWVEDAGVSGKTLARPGMADALERLASGQASVLVCSRLDRLSRSMLDFANLVATSQAQGWKLLALDIGVDTTTAEGELMANVRASVSTYERRLISMRTREALAAKRSRGERLGRAPVIPEAAADLARTLRADGLTFDRIGTELQAAGYLPPSGTWYPMTVRRLLVRAAA